MLAARKPIAPPREPCKKGSETRTCRRPNPASRGSGVRFFEGILEWQTKASPLPFPFSRDPPLAFSNAAVAMPDFTATKQSEGWRYGYAVMTEKYRTTMSKIHCKNPCGVPLSTKYSEACTIILPCKYHNSKDLVQRQS